MHDDYGLGPVDDRDEPERARAPSPDELDMPSGTMKAPLRYPNLETATQVSRAISKPRQFRRTASKQEDCLRVLNKTFGKAAFRGRQKEIMEAAIRGADVLVVAPTGMGKSLCYQVPAIADDHGITIVLSPLLSLMKNQVENLRAQKIKVWMLSSETDRSERLKIEKDLASGHPLARLLYLTPEALMTEQFTKSLRLVVKNGELKRLVVDEAHCISEWGSSFRPHYRKLGFFRDNFPSIPIMALTASATADVENDIVESLKMSAEHMLRVVEPFNRHNLYYEVKYRPEPDQTRLPDITAYIQSLHRKAPPNPKNPSEKIPVPGIIYCRSRASCDVVSEYLRSNGIAAKAFHKGLKARELDTTLDEWLKGEVGCVVATIAFGMGIDKPDVRYVIHFDLPKSFEGYYQETGRAGRDGHVSRCLLYYSREDALRLRKLVEQEKGKAMKGAAIGDPEDADVNRGVDSFKSVQHYAESTTTCRHVNIARYFGEKIDENDEVIREIYCKNMCDVCRDRAKVSKKSKNLSEEISIASQVPIRHKKLRSLLLPTDVDNGSDTPEIPDKQPEEETISPENSTSSASETFIKLAPHALEALENTLDQDTQLPAGLQSIHVICRGTSMSNLEEEEWILDDREETVSDQKEGKGIATRTTLDRTARWAASEDGRTALLAAGLDINDYGMIALLAGSRTVTSAAQERLMNANPKLMTPYLPPAIDPSNSSFSIAKEYRSISKELSAILNVLFSVGGVAGGVWWVARNSSGMSNEKATLAAFISACVVAFAEAWLYIAHFSRLEEQKVLSAKMRELNIKPDSEAVPKELVEEEGSPEVGSEEGDEGLVGVADTVALASAREEPRQLRLRRKPLGNLA